MPGFRTLTGEFKWLKTYLHVAFTAKVHGFWSLSIPPGPLDDPLSGQPVDPHAGGLWSLVDLRHGHCRYLGADWILNGRLGHPGLMANLLKLKVYEEVSERNGRFHWSIPVWNPILLSRPMPSQIQ